MGAGGGDAGAGAAQSAIGGPSSSVMESSK